MSPSQSLVLGQPLWTPELSPAPATVELKWPWACGKEVHIDHTKQDASQASS